MRQMSSSPAGIAARVAYLYQSAVAVFLGKLAIWVITCSTDDRCVRHDVCRKRVSGRKPLRGEKGVKRALWYVFGRCCGPKGTKRYGKRSNIGTNGLKSRNGPVPETLRLSAIVDGIDDSVMRAHV